jgi:protocatechuate 4,5-dioxygenase beta chain/2,3-dihydroxyphenylpropionate 1,2-dioxygenase
MGRVVGVFATAHSPGLTGFPDRADPAKRARITAAFDSVRSCIAELAPDAIVAVSVEHFTNFSLANLPTFAIATASSYLGPVTPQMAEFLNIPQRRYAGAAELGEHLYRFALSAEFDPSLVSGDLDFDENFCVPLALLDPATRIPLVPVIVNGVNRPGPTTRRCYAFGQMIRAAIEAYGGASRVVVLGTGGLSHWVGMRESGDINEPFDRDFLQRLSSDDPSPLLAYEQKEINVAGNGADEIRAWIVAAGAAGTGFNILAYEPTPAWLTGTAVAAARLHQGETDQGAPHE